MKKVDTLKEIVNDIFGFLQLNPITDITEEGDNTFKITITGNNLNHLIGFRGTSLEAMENLVELMLFRKFNEPSMIVLDINGYKNQKIERLQDLAKKMIDKVRFFQNDVELPFMNAWERRQVHMLVAEYDDVLSESLGEDPNRRVVLKTKKKTSGQSKN